MRRAFLASVSGVWFFLGAGPGALAQANSDPTNVEADGDVIVVTGTRTERELLDMPVAITVQDFDELNARGFTYGTDEFCSVPGVFFRRGDERHAGNAAPSPRDAPRNLLRKKVRKCWQPMARRNAMDPPSRSTRST